MTAIIQKLRTYKKLIFTCLLALSFSYPALAKRSDSAPCLRGKNCSYGLNQKTSYSDPICKAANVSDKNCFLWLLEWEQAKMSIPDFLKNCKKTHSDTYCMELLSEYKPAKKEIQFVQEETYEEASVAF